MPTGARSTVAVMSTAAPFTHVQRKAELEAEERAAWRRYLEGVRDREGRDYEVAEPAAWDQLRAELAELEQERALLGSSQALE